MVKKVAIIGAGEIGRALEKILKVKQEVEVNLWDKDEKKVVDQKSLEESVKDADMIFLCVPSTAERAAIESFKDFLKLGSMVVSLTKGIVPESLETVDEVMAELLPKSEHFGVLAGPILAEEIELDLIGAGLLASRNMDVLMAGKELFEGTKLRIDTSSDITGAALAGVLKNVYAIALGIMQGLDLGNNARGWLISESLKEMGLILQLLGGKQETVYGLAGLGDLFATGMSEYSSNHQLGIELGRKGKSKVISEGLRSLPALVSMVDARLKELKVFKAVMDVVSEKHDPRTVFEGLIFGR